MSAPHPAEPPSAPEKKPPPREGNPPAEHLQPTDPPPFEPEEPASDGQARLAFALLNDLGVTTREDRLRVGCALLQRNVTTFQDLTRSEASQLIDTLGTLNASEQGHDQLDAIVSRYFAEPTPMPPEDPHAAQDADGEPEDPNGDGDADPDDDIWSL